MTSRRAAWLLLVGCVLDLAGCAHMAEKRALEAFRSSLGKGDLIGLRQATSDRFEQKALRLDQAVDDLKVLRLPTKEKPEFVSVEDLSKTEKLVTVQTGESKRKLKYHLVREDGQRKWVVDDVYLRQKKDGVTSVKSVTEQMDLLLTVRETLRAWGAGDRDAILAGATKPLRAALDPLPPGYLGQLSTRIVGDPSRLEKVRPEAQLDDNVAVVKVPRPTGQIVVTFELADGTWLASDMAVESRGDDGHIPSVQKHAIALETAVRFLRAYRAGDRKTLAAVCTRKFYESGLAPADLKSVPLPAPDEPRPDQQFRIIAKRAEMVIPADGETVKVSMIREDAKDDDSPVVYRVEDVTLYDLAGSQEKRLSSVFTAQAMMALFAEALAARDLPVLRKASSADFNRRVWERLRQSGPAGSVPAAAAASHTTIDDLPLGEIPPDDPILVATEHNGALTEIRVRQGEAELTYLLREHAGEVRVDDIIFPAPGRPRSLKETAELIVPLREFTAGLARRDLGVVQRNASDEYNRMVWKQTDRMPDSATRAVRHLSAPLTGVETRGDQTLVTLGDEHWGAKIVLAKEASRHVVDDVMLIAGVESAQRTRMKQAMRLELAGTQARRLRDAESPSPLLDEDKGVVPVGATRIMGRKPRGTAAVPRDPDVVNAGYQRYADEPLPPEELPDSFDAIPLPRRTSNKPPRPEPIEDFDSELAPPEPDDTAFLPPGADLMDQSEP